MSRTSRLFFISGYSLVVLVSVFFVVACGNRGGTATTTETPSDDPLTPTTTIPVTLTIPPEEAITPTPPPSILGFTPCDDFSNAINESIDVINPGNEYFRDQLVVIGYLNEDVGARDVRSIVDDDFNGRLDPLRMQLVQFQDPNIISKTVIIDVYQVAAGENVAALAEEFNNIASEDQLELGRAEPNYILSNPVDRFQNSIANPLGVEGFPGSPGAEGAPGAAPVILQNLDVGVFESQWAFTMTGKIDTSYFVPNQQQIKNTPPVANLLILDSAPSSNVDLTDDQLCIKHLFPHSPIVRFADSHGLFVASLAGSMAYEGNIHLIEVLKANDQNHLEGDLVTVLSALFQHQQHIGQARSIEISDSLDLPERNVAHTVVNMSLGFTLDPEQEESLFTSIRQDAALPDYLKNILETESGDALVNMPVVSLGVMSAYLEKNGYVLVAAAGNDHQDRAQAPASYPNVIGVQAVPYVNIAGNPDAARISDIVDVHKLRSCFSNRGNISAPGGGLPIPNSLTELYSSEPCILDLANCPNCALIGHVFTDTHKLGLWAGTSFAAPLVSGLAVSIIEVGFAQEEYLSVDEVRSAVYCTVVERESEELMEIAQARQQIPNDLEELLNSNRSAKDDSVGIINVAKIEPCVALVVSLRSP